MWLMDTVLERSDYGAFLSSWTALLDLAPIAGGREWRSEGGRHAGSRQREQQGWRLWRGVCSLFEELQCGESDRRWSQFGQQGPGHTGPSQHGRGFGHFCDWEVKAPGSFDWRSDMICLQKFVKGHVSCHVDSRLWGTKGTVKIIDHLYHQVDWVAR